MSLSIERETELARFIASFRNDPYGLVMAMYPWGSRRLPDGGKERIAGMETLPNGSPNPLIDKTGPDKWQRRELIALGKHMQENADREELGLEMIPWKAAYGTGHGVGKTAFVSWIIHIIMSTRRDTRGAVTATTQFQLDDKTWAELAKWHDLLINKHWFKWSASAYTFAPYPEEKQKNYRIAAATVSEHNTEAFAGLHNEGKAVLIIFDEASGVRGKVWEVAEGAMTDGEVFFFALGNCTDPDGEFAKCFDEYEAFYRTQRIDSRDVELSNKLAIQQMIDKYGYESDVVKVRVRGIFPSQSYNGFISSDAVNEAMKREEVRVDRDAPLIMAVDVAHYGTDETIIGFRQGWDARSIPMLTFRGLNTIQVADRVAKIADARKPDGIIIESVGPGIGVIDQLKARNYRVHRAYPGAPHASQHYVNNRAEWWSQMRDWIYEHGCIPEDKELYQQLTQVQYTLSRHSGKTLIESKEDMRKRGLPSPDRADMLMLTFAIKIARRDRRNMLDAEAGRHRTAKIEYDPLMI